MDHLISLEFVPPTIFEDNSKYIFCYDPGQFACTQLYVSNWNGLCDNREPLEYYVSILKTNDLLFYVRNINVLYEMKFYVEFSVY